MTQEGLTIDSHTLVVVLPTIFLILLCAWIVKRFSSERSHANQQLTNKSERKNLKLSSGSVNDNRTKPALVEKTTQQKQKKRHGVQSGDGQKSFNHSWLLSTLKAHTNFVLNIDFSPNKKYLASCSEDRTVMLWHVNDFKDKNHRNARCNIEFDHASRIRWSPDSKAFVIARSTNRDLEVFRINKLADGNLGKTTSSLTFAQHHKGDIVGLGIASNGKFIMTCSADTKLIIWSPKGEILTSIDTRQIDVYFADVSHCGRFVASCGFTSDVKVWHVVFDKTDAFKEVARAFELKGHGAGVESFAFNNDSSKMVSVSKDKTWKFWNTNVEFEKGQDPHLLFSVNIALQGPAKIALSLDAKVVAVASASILRLYSTLNGKEERSINNDGQIQALAFDPQGNLLAVAVDKHIRLFHNVVGYRTIIQELEEHRKQPSISQSLKQRMQQQIADAKAALQAIGEN